NRGVSQRLGGLHGARLAIESLDFGEVAAMESAGDWDGIARILIDCARRLEASGGEGLIIASNTVHKCYEAVAATVSVPVLHIGDAVPDRLVADGRKRVDLIGTRITTAGAIKRTRNE